MVKTPLYPDYKTVANLLKILEGTCVQDFKDSWNTIWSLRGTPQNTVNWKDPDTWIKERLNKTDKEIALKIWNESGKSINPRYTRGTQFLMNGYGLIKDVKGEYQLTEKGKVFISGQENKIVRDIDIEEGLIQVLLQLSIIKKGKRSDFLEDWGKYLESNSNVKKDSTTKDYLRRRLVNLVARGYTKMEGNIYSITEEGFKYLDTITNKDSNTTLRKKTELSRLVENFITEQRQQLRSFLENNEPYQFEHIIKDLLSSMGYEEVEVTSPANDKGVDVTGVSQNGITTVKEVIQVKRNTKSNIQRPILDGLRGSLHRFEAFQGTIITLSDFSKGAKEAAFETGAAPMTLINGEKLIDLLIEYKIGIKPNHFSYYIVDEKYFSTEEEENIE